MPTAIHIDVETPIADLVKQFVDTIEVFVIRWLLMSFKDVLCDFVTNFAKLHQKI
jgi:hypothetical protein